MQCDTAGRGYGDATASKHILVSIFILWSVCGTNTSWLEVTATDKEDKIDTAGKRKCCNFIIQ